jgi:predicted solute-binding protein
MRSRCEWLRAADAALRVGDNALHTWHRELKRGTMEDILEGLGSDSKMG